MEMEYKDNNRRGKFVIIAGVVLAIVAGAASFYLISQARNESPGETTLVDVVVALQIGLLQLAFGHQLQDQRHR